MDKPKVIFEDQELLILNKPSGWIVNNASTVKEQPVIQKWLFNKLNYPISKNFELRSGVVHRIDKETSGVLIVAKTEKSFRNLQKQFKERKVKKTYLTLVHGELIPSRGEIEVPVGRLPWKRERFGILAGGRASKTSYEVTESFEKEQAKYSLVECHPETGRTHQIRIHMKHLNHPIVSDQFYAGRKTSREDRKWCPRLFLHASEISFIHPFTNKKVFYKADLPEDLKKVLKGFSLKKKI